MHRPVFVAIIVGSLASCHVRQPLPRTMIWAWERDEDLRGAPAEVGVAFLAATIEIHGDRLRIVRRQHALLVDDATVKLPVVRLEAEEIDESVRQRLVPIIVALANDRGVQLDFESRLSQRDFHAQLLRDLRRALPSRAWLSSTALASWCLGDRWMAPLPVDEIVPMFYRLAADGPVLRSRLAAGADLAPECRGALGTSIDEPYVAPPFPRRSYLFSRAAWRPALLDHALRTHR